MAAIRNRHAVRKGYQKDYKENLQKETLGNPFQRMKRLEEERQAKEANRIQQLEWIQQAKARRRAEQEEAFSSDNDSYLKRREATRLANDELGEDTSIIPMNLPVVHHVTVCNSYEPIKGNHYGLTNREARRLSKLKVSGSVSHLKIQTKTQ